MDLSNIDINLNKFIPQVNINIHTIKKVLFYLFIFLTVICVLFVISSYYIIKLLNIDIYDFNVFFYDYNKNCKRILEKYGDCKISKIYLTRKPFSKSITFILNIISMYEYDKLMINKNNSFLRHNGIIFEVKLNNGQEKLLFLEKNNSINICENFFIQNKQELKRIIIKKNYYTINDILNSTQKKIGSEKYFNWHIYKNNCKIFIKELLKTIGKYNKSNKDFISHEVNIDTFVNTVIPSEFTQHMINSTINIFNIIEKYICDFDFFY